MLLRQLLDIDCDVVITTKSGLVLRDLDLLIDFKNLLVSVSINTLDEGFKNDMDRAYRISDRLHALKTLHEAGIHTALFISPIFPCITDFREIIETSRSYVDEFWFENLNLRAGYKQDILNYIASKYPFLAGLYDDIYRKGEQDYWYYLSDEIRKYCKENDVLYTDYFYHKKLVQAKKEGAPLI
jgi:DNA repair photolyase